MHPAHHPFHSETQTIIPGWFGYTGPVGCFFRDGLHIGKIPVDSFIEVFDESNGFEVTISAEFILLPLSVFPGIIQLEHGAYSIYPDTVDVKEIKPKPG